MLDKRCFALLNAIVSVCDGSGYKIFSLSELIDKLPDYLGVESEGLNEALNSLSEHELISIKYFDEKEICLRPLIKGRVAVESVNEKELSEKALKRKLILFSFFGGLLGSFLSAVIFYLIRLLGGV